MTPDLYVEMLGRMVSRHLPDVKTVIDFAPSERIVDSLRAAYPNAEIIAVDTMIESAPHVAEQYDGVITAGPGWFDWQRTILREFKQPSLVSFGNVLQRLPMWDAVSAWRAAHHNATAVALGVDYPPIDDEVKAMPWLHHQILETFLCVTDYERTPVSGVYFGNC